MKIKIDNGIKAVIIFIIFVVIAFSGMLFGISKVNAGFWDFLYPKDNVGSSLRTFISSQLGGSATDGYILKTDGSKSTWVATSTLNIQGTPAGSDGQVQFNDSGDFGADANLYWDNTNNRLGIGTSTPQENVHIYEDKTGILRMELENPSSAAAVVSGATRSTYSSHF